MVNLDQLSHGSNRLMGACSGVYFLFQDDELVYIGEGWNCLLRVAEHTRKESNKVFNRWNYLPVEEKEERKRLEASLRAELKPRFNRI